jgi:tetratricopeptide (TPR) repeat protein
MESGKPDRATAPLRHAISLRPEVPDNYLILLRAYLESEDVLKRWGRVTKVLKERFKKSPEVLLNAGNLLIHYSKLRSALDYFNDLLQQGLIKKWVYHLKLGQMYLLLRRYEDARKELEASIVANPGSALTLYYLGRVWKEQGNQAYMLSYFKHAMEKGLDGEPKQYVEKVLGGLLNREDQQSGAASEKTK